MQELAHRTPDHGTPEFNSRSRNESLSTHPARGLAAKKAVGFGPAKEASAEAHPPGQGGAVRRRTTACMAQRSRTPGALVQAARHRTALQRSSSVGRIQAPATRPPQLEPSVTVEYDRSAPIGSRTKCRTGPSMSRRRADRTGASAATWMMSSTHGGFLLPRRTRWCPRGGRGGCTAAAHLDQVALRQPVQRGIEADARSLTAERAAQDPQPASCRRSRLRRGSIWRARAAPSTSTPQVPLASRPGPAASFGNLTRSVAMSLADIGACAPTSWQERRAVPVRVRSGSLIWRASLDERKALGICIREDSFGRADDGARLGGSMHGTPVRGTSNVRPWNPVVTAIAGLPPFPRHRTRTPRECPEGSAPVGEKTEGVRRREARLAAGKTPARAGLLDVPPPKWPPETRIRGQKSP